MEKTDNKAFELYDIKQEIVNNSYKLKIVEKNVNTLAVNLKKNEIVEKELSSLSDETRMYDKCGRIFYISPKITVISKIKENKKKLSSDLETQKELMKKLQEQVTESSKHYNEIARKVMEENKK